MQPVLFRDMFLLKTKSLVGGGWVLCHRAGKVRAALGGQEDLERVWEAEKPERLVSPGG